MKTKKITLVALFIAIGALLGNVIFIPIGASKCFPVQHAINVLIAVILGPSYGITAAFSISLLRNILGTGTLLAFPGSMIGAFFAGILYKKTHKPILAVIGEIVGSGVIGGILAYPISKLIIVNDVSVLFFVLPFLVSTIGGSIVSYAFIKILDISNIYNLNNNFKED